MSFKGTAHAYLPKVSIKNNNKQVSLLYQLINCTSAISAPQMLSLKDKYILWFFNNLLIIDLFNCFTNSWFLELIFVPLQVSSSYAVFFHFCILSLFLVNDPQPLYVNSSCFKCISEKSALLLTNICWLFHSFINILKQTFPIGAFIFCIVLFYIVTSIVCKKSRLSMTTICTTGN